MSPESSSIELPKGRSKWLVWGRALPWVGVVACLLAIVPIQWTAHTDDFAEANVFTTLLATLCWLLAALGLYLSSLPRSLWKLTFFSPILALAVWLSIFKVKRLDGELRPRFSYRWQSDANLVGTEATAGPELGGIAIELRQQSETDFPQFLGRNRDAMIPNVSIDEDWKSRPPRIAWKQSVGEGWSGFSVQGDVAITMEQREDQEWVTAYNVKSGGLLWIFPMDSKHTNVLGGVGPRSTPTIANDRVYACSAVSQIVCLELATGREVWMRELLKLGRTSQASFEERVAWGRSASPLVFANKVIIPLGGAGANLSTLIALDCNSGNELWRGGTDQISYSSPSFVTLAGVPQILLTSEQMVGGYSPENGDLLWSVPWPGKSNSSASVSQPVVVSDSRVLISKGYGEGSQMLDVALREGKWVVEPAWTNPSGLRTKFTSSVIHDGYAYGLSDGILDCLDLKDGTRKWKAGRYRQGQVLLVGSHLLITAENGEVVLVRATPDGLQEVDKLDVLGDVTWNTAALSGDRLLMRNSDEAACVILPLTK